MLVSLTLVYLRVWLQFNNPKQLAWGGGTLSQFDRDPEQKSGLDLKYLTDVKYKMIVTTTQYSVVASNSNNTINVKLILNKYLQFEESLGQFEKWIASDPAHPYLDDLKISYAVQRIETADSIASLIQ